MITRSLADSIEDTEKAVIIGTFSLGKSIIRNLCNPYMLILFEMSSFSCVILKKDGARKLYVNGSEKIAFRTITIRIFGISNKLILNNKI